MTINCGNCKGQHDSVAQVRACHDINKGQPRATDKQKAFIKRLMAERSGSWKDYRDSVWLDSANEFHKPLWATLSKRQASELIEFLLACPKREEAKVPARELEAGIYSRDGVVYKVYKAVHGSGQMCAKELVTTEAKEASWEYKGLATRFVSEDDRMTLEQAKEFGTIYGVCCACGRTLTDEASIAAGIGPVCATKF